MTNHPIISAIARLMVLIALGIYVGVIASLIIGAR